MSDRASASWRRRALTIPTTIFVATIATAAAPAALPLALVADVVSPRRLSATRTALFFLAFLWAETLGLFAAAWLWLRHRSEPGRFASANHRLQRRWAGGLFDVANRLFGVSVEIDGADAVERPGPVLLLVRHASTMDTVIPFVVDPNRRFRYVLKAELLLDPCLDVVGHRLPNCFVRRGSDRREREVARVVALGRGVDDDEAVVLYPEGTRFTPAKRQELLERMDERGDPALVLARDLQHTLSPLRSGPVALGTTTPDLDVVFVAHTGIERAASLGDLVSGGLTDATLRIRLWRVAATDIPRDDEGFRRFLAAHWRRVDAFVADPTKGHL